MSNIVQINNYLRNIKIESIDIIDNKTINFNNKYKLLAGGDDGTDSYFILPEDNMKSIILLNIKNIDIINIKRMSSNIEKTYEINFTFYNTNQKYTINMINIICAKPNGFISLTLE